MPIRMELREHERVIYYEFTDPWELVELLALYRQNNLIRNERQETIHAIANLTGMRQLPKDVMSASHQSPDVDHPRAGHIILIGPSHIVRRMAELVIWLVRSEKFEFVNTEEEAWTTVREIIASENSD